MVVEGRLISCGILNIMMWKKIKNILEFFDDEKRAWRNCGRGSVLKETAAWIYLSATNSASPAERKTALLFPSTRSEKIW